MKIVGVFLIVFGIFCFGLVATGFVAWTTPAGGGAGLAVAPVADTAGALAEDQIEAELDAVAPVAEAIGVRMRLFSVAGIVCIIGGAVALILGIRKSRDRNRQGLKEGFRRPIAVTFVGMTVLACAVFAIFKVMTRWDPDEEWAAKVIEESTDIRLLLEKYRKENGEFPMSLSDIGGVHTQPTDFLTRNAAEPDTDRWFYDRIGKEDYQLFVTADSWVSYFDAIVYRHTGAFADPWFSTLDSSDSRDLGKWRYVQGFSKFHENYYFDADGKVHSHYR